MAKSEEFIVSGAKMSCPYGSLESYLVVSLSHGYFIGGNPVAHYKDCIPGVNFQPFGYCNRRKGLCKLDRIAGTFLNYSLTDVISTKFGVTKMIKDTIQNILLALDWRSASFDSLIKKLEEMKKDKSEDQIEKIKKIVQKIELLKEEDLKLRELANTLENNTPFFYEKILKACTDVQNKFVTQKKELQELLSNKNAMKAGMIDAALKSGIETLDNSITQKPKEITIIDIAIDLDNDMSFIVAQINYISQIQKPSNYFLITKSSFLQCGRGRKPITFKSSGQEDYVLIDEKVHVMIFVNRGEDFEPEYDKNAYTVRIGELQNDTAKAINDNIIKYLGGARQQTDLQLFDSDSCKYVDSYFGKTTVIREQYLPFVFPGFITARRLVINMENSRQIDFQFKLAQHNRNIETCVKLFYMVYYGTGASVLYLKDFAAYILETKIGSKNLSPEASRYASAKNFSSYGMWGKYYDPANGWHRGIDMQSIGSMAEKDRDHIYAIANGKFIGSDKVNFEYYFNVFYDDGDEGFTITYMHNRLNTVTESYYATLSQKALKNGELIAAESSTDPNLLFQKAKNTYNAYCDYYLAAHKEDSNAANVEELKNIYLALLREILPVLPDIETGNFISYESNLWSIPVHEHIEFNKGFFLGNIKRPDSSSYYVADIDSIIEGYPFNDETPIHEFSSNPYGYIEMLFQIHDL